MPIRNCLASPVAAGVVAASGTHSRPGVGMRGGEIQNKGGIIDAFFSGGTRTEAKMQRDGFTRSRMSPRAAHLQATLMWGGRLLDLSTEY